MILINCTVIDEIDYSETVSDQSKTAKVISAMGNWANHRDALFNRIPSWGAGPNVLVSSASGSVVITHSRFDAFEGEGHAQPYTFLGLCMAGGGRTQKKSDFGQLDDVWQPGRVGLALPGAAQGFSPSMDMLLIAFDLNDVPACHGKKLHAEDLHVAATQLFDDQLVSSVLIALLRDAEAHGAASAFFEHGLSLALHRLATRTNTNACLPHHYRFNQSRLTGIVDLIEARLDEDLRVKELASSLGIGTRTFTRMFKHETGFTPYRYLTIRRMERAKTLLKSNSSVTDTASAVGYANPAKFAAAFRRWVGMAPSEWKDKALM